MQLEEQLRSKENLELELGTMRELKERVMQMQEAVCMHYIRIHTRTHAHKPKAEFGARAGHHASYANAVAHINALSTP